MLLIGNIYQELQTAFTGVMRKSESNRIKTHQEFADFYENDYEAISEHLRAATLNNPYSFETLKDLKFRHVNVINKIISRMTSGIFTKDPVLEFGEADDADIEKLAALLKQIKFIAKVKEAFKKAVYFNIVEAHVVYDIKAKEMRIDIVTPNNFVVETKQDYLQKSAIAVRKADEKGEIYWSYWSETEHYIMRGNEKIAPEENLQMVNPYFKGLKPDAKKYALPFATLRIEEGCDYFGEPNWNVFLHQKNLDVRLTDLNDAELKTIHQIYFGVNTSFTDRDTFRAGDFKQVNNVKEEDKQPSITSITSDVDYTSVRENINWHNELVMSSEGISASSASTDQSKAQSGAAKVIDEIELYEKREEYKNALYYFMEHLLNVVRVVWNNYNPNDKLADADFNISFTESKIFESVADKQKRHEMGIKFGYKDEIDVTMEELEISEEEAVKRILDRQKRRKEHGLLPEPVKPEEPPVPPAQK